MRQSPLALRSCGSMHYCSGQQVTGSDESGSGNLPLPGSVRAFGVGKMEAELSPLTQWARELSEPEAWGHSEKVTGVPGVRGRESPPIPLGRMEQGKKREAGALLVHQASTCVQTHVHHLSSICLTLCWAATAQGKLAPPLRPACPPGLLTSIPPIAPGALGM